MIVIPKKTEDFWLHFFDSLYQSGVENISGSIENFVKKVEDTVYSEKNPKEKILSEEDRQRVFGTSKFEATLSKFEEAGLVTAKTKNKKIINIKINSDFMYNKKFIPENIGSVAKKITEIYREPSQNPQKILLKVS